MMLNRKKHPQNFIKFLIVFLTAFFVYTPVFSRTVLITGGNRGIGFALVEAYLAEGHRVYTTYRSEDKSRELLGLELRLGKQKLTAIKVNLLDDNCEQTICGVIGEDPLDIIIHIDKKEWLESFTINAIVPVTLTLALQSNLCKGQVKKVVAISSRRASIEDTLKDNYTGRFAYRTSKAALNMGMVALSQELREKQITVIMLHPGRVATEMTKGDGMAPSASAKNIMSAIERVGLEDAGSFIDTEAEQLRSKL